MEFLSIGFMKRKFLEKKLSAKADKAEAEMKRKTGKEKSVKSDQLSAPPEGYFSLIVLSKKYGYAKDYIGWLSRTGRIEAVRYGKYSQWYVHEESLKQYISSIANA